MALLHKANAFAKLGNRKLRPEAGDFRVVRQKWSSILMNVLYEPGDVWNVFSASGVQPRAGFFKSMAR